MQKVVLVTGSAGYIASKLIPELARTYSVHGLDLKDSSPIKKYCDEWITADITALPEITVKYHAIIHTVATFTKDPVVAYKINVDGTRNIIELAKKIRCKLVFISTCGTLNSEDRSTYTITKGIAEDSVVNYWPEKSTIVRLASVYGSAPVMNYEGIVNNFVNNAIKMRSLDIIGANEYRPVVHIDNAIDSIVEAVESKRGQMNVVSENVTKQQIVDCIVKHCGNVTVDAKQSDKPGYIIEPCLKDAIKLEQRIREMITSELSNKIVSGKRN